MKTLDLLIIVPLLWGAYIGYKQGLLMSLVGILAFVLAVILGFKLMDTGLDLLKPYFSSSNRFLPYIAFAAIFFPIILLVNKLGQLLRKSIQYTLIGSFDSMAGSPGGRVHVGLRRQRVPVAGVRGGRQAAQGYHRQYVLYPVVAPIAPVAITKASNLLPMGKDLLHSLQSAIQHVTKG
jgi:membrane protein required for colicin V production